MPEFGIVHAMSLKQSFTFRGCSSISPLLSIFLQFFSVLRFPFLEVDSSTGRLVITIACTAVEVTADPSHRSNMTSGGKVTNNHGNGTTSKPAMEVTSGVEELDTALPCIYQIIDEWTDIVVEVF
jgi:hypothetical protein